MKTTPIGPLFHGVLKRLVGKTGIASGVKCSKVVLNSTDRYSGLPFVCSFCASDSLNSSYPGLAAIAFCGFLWTFFCAICNISKGVVLGFCSQVRFVGKFSRSEVPKMDFFPTNSYSRSEVASSMFLLCTKKSRDVIRVRTALVALVLGYRSLSEICDSVVRWVAVYVVNLVSWVRAMHIKPSKPMSLKPDAANGNVSPPLGSAGSRNVAGLCSSTGNAPCKNPGFRGVRKKLSQVGGSQFFFYNEVSHKDSFKVGLVRACVAVQTPHRLVQFTGVTA